MKWFYKLKLNLASWIRESAIQLTKVRILLLVLKKLLLWKARTNFLIRNCIASNTFVLQTLRATRAFLRNHNFSVLSSIFETCASRRRTISLLTSRQSPVQHTYRYLPELRLRKRLELPSFATSDILKSIHIFFRRVKRMVISGNQDLCTDLCPFL